MYTLVAVIPTFNRKELLKNLLTQLVKQKGDNFSLQTLVVVDGSSDGTLEMLSNEFPNTKIVKGTGQWWFTKSLNEGIKMAQQLSPDYILTLNDDVVLADNFVAKILADCLSVNKGHCIIGSLTLSVEEPDKILFAGIKKIDFIKGSVNQQYLPRNTTYIPKVHKGIKSSPTLPTRGTLIPIEFIKILKGFDERFPQYGSDTDFTLRAFKGGYSVNISYNSIIYAYSNLTGTGSPKTSGSYYMYLQNIISNKYSPTHIGKDTLFIWLHFPKILFPWYLIILLLGTQYAYFKHRKTRGLNSNISNH